MTWRDKAKRLGRWQDLRVELAGAWHHVVARGNERQSIFRDDRDRGHFLECFKCFMFKYDPNNHGYGQGIPNDPTTVVNIVNTVYSTLPLTK